MAAVLNKSLLIRSDTRPGVPTAMWQLFAAAPSAVKESPPINSPIFTWAVYLPIVVITSWIWTASSRVGAKTNTCRLVTGLRVEAVGVEIGVGDGVGGGRDGGGPGGGAVGGGGGAAEPRGAAATTTASRAMTENTHVLTVPDLACATRSTPTLPKGIAFNWIGDGIVNRHQFCHLVRYMH